MSVLIYCTSIILLVPRWSCIELNNWCWCRVHLCNHRVWKDVMSKRFAKELYTIIMSVKRTHTICSAFCNFCNTYLYRKRRLKSVYLSSLLAHHMTLLFCPRDQVVKIQKIITRKWHLKWKMTVTSISTTIPLITGKKLSYNKVSVRCIT